MWRHSERLRGGLVASVAAAVAIGLPSTALAAEVRTGDTIVIPAGETIRDDVYAFGSSVTINGAVDGAVIAAGTTVTINGHVTGDVMAAGTTVTVAGPVDGSVRVAGNVLTISGPVARDLLAAGSTLAVSGTGQVGRDVLAAGGTLDLLGPVGRDVKAAGETLAVSSIVGGGVQAQVANLAFGNDAAVQGPVSLVSQKDASIASGARVPGPIQRSEPPSRASNAWEIAGVNLLGLVQGFVGVAVLGAIFVLLFRRATLEASLTERRRWLASLGLGFGLLVGLPILAVLIFGVGLVVGGWWIGVMLLGAYGLLAVLGYIESAESVGLVAARLAKWQVHPIWDMLLGLAIVGLLTLIPVIGGIVALAAVTLGLGALTLRVWDAYRGTPTTLEPSIGTPAPTSLAMGA